MKLKAVFFGNCVYTIKIFRIPLLNELQKKGYEVYYWTPKTNLRKYENGCLDQITEPTKEVFRFYHLLSIFSVLYNNNVKLIIANTHIIAFPAILISKILKIKKRIYYLTGFGGAYNQKNKVLKKIFRVTVFIFFNFATHVIVQNRIDKKIIQKKSQVKIIETLGTGAPEIKKNEFIQKNKKKLNVVFAGRLMESKGLNDFIYVINECNKKNQDINFYIFSMPEYIDRYKKVFNLKNVKFFGFDDNVISKLKEMHVAIYLSKYAEGSPRFLIESAMNGIALVVLKNLRSNDIVQKNGFVINSKEEMIKKLFLYAKNKKLLKLHMYESKKISKKYIDINIAKEIISQIN
jgi:glycosyltransferase involved in cell wall biosynthesis